MTIRTTITLDDDAYRFLQTEAGKNKSAFINKVLKKEKQQSLEQAMLKANREEAEDAEYQEEISTWDETLSDGLPPDV